MKTEILKYAICPYGRTTNALKLVAKHGKFHPGSSAVIWFDKESYHISTHIQVVWVTTSRDLDEKFVEHFHEHSPLESRVLVINDRQTTDALCTSLLDLQIRKSERLYVADCLGTEPSDLKTHLNRLVQRLFVALGGGEKNDRILDATIDSDTLRVVSANFKRLKIPLDQISATAKQDRSALTQFEIDEDGSFIYWPALDVHLGWEQLEQIANPEAARKAMQKSADFNVRYGKAIKKFREEAGLKPGDIIGLSEKQLGRIERGDCRLTSNATELLAKAHQLSPNEYLGKLAEYLNAIPAPALRPAVSRTHHFMPNPGKAEA